MITSDISMRSTTFISFGVGLRLTANLLLIKSCIKMSRKEFSFWMGVNIKLILTILTKLLNKFTIISNVLKKFSWKLNLSKLSRKNSYQKCRRDWKFTIKSSTWSFRRLLKGKTILNWSEPILLEGTKTQLLRLSLKTSWHIINTIVEKRQMWKCWKN